MLVVAEVALALVLLVSAGLLLRSLTRLMDVNPGFDASNMLAMAVQISGPAFEKDSSPTGIRERFFSQALEQVRHVPGVESAAFVSILPLTGDTPFGHYGGGFEKNQKWYDVYRYVATPGYFETMRIPLRRGRYLEKGDLAGAPHVVDISESLAKKVFGNENPLGQRMHIGGFPNWPWYTIVGVVGDVKQASLAANDLDAVYITPQQSWFADRTMSLVVRARASAAALIPALKKAIWSVNKDQPIERIETMQSLVAATAAQRSFVLMLFEAFGIVALALAAVGIYGVLSGSVTERTREIGIRLALGAPRGNILALVVRQGMLLTAAGMLIGLGGALAASQAIAAQLFSVSPLDAATYLAVILLLGGVAVIACWVPAWRASRLDPCVTLRAE